MEDSIRQLLMQELQDQGEDSGEDVESGGNPTITPESKAGVGIASLINAIVGAKAMKGSGNAGLGALYGGASTYGEGMGNLQKAAAQAQTNRSKEERIKSLIKNQIFKQNFDTVKFLEERKLKEDKAKKDALAAQNYSILLDPSNFTDMTPDDEGVARSHVLSTMAGQDPGMAKDYNRDISASEDRKAAMQQRGDIAKESLALRGEIARGNLDLRKTAQGEKVNQKTNAQRNVSGLLNEMKGYYVELNKEDAIVDTEKSALENIGARMGSSGVGQFVGKTIGTKTQSLRNKIAQAQPLLINYIRQASQMGARGLDSEKELQFYLQAATDPKLDIQMNLKALNVLNNAYGLVENNKGGGQTSSGNRFTIKEIK